MDTPGNPWRPLARRSLPEDNVHRGEKNESHQT